MQQEVRSESVHTEDADIVLVAYGLSARISLKVMELAREQGIAVGMIRPITLYPFPTDTIAAAADHVKAFLTLEMNAGQMVEDVRLAVNGKKPVYFYGRMGGMIPAPDEVLALVKQIAASLKGEKSL